MFFCRCLALQTSFKPFCNVKAYLLSSLRKRISKKNSKNEIGSLVSLLRWMALNFFCIFYCYELICETLIVREFQIECATQSFTSSSKALYLKYHHGLEIEGIWPAVNYQSVSNLLYRCSYKSSQEWNDKITDNYNFVHNLLSVFNNLIQKEYTIKWYIKCCPLCCVIHT
jgi:hypothetical protein